MRKIYLADFVKAVLRGIWDGFGITDTIIIVIIVLFYLSARMGLSGSEDHPPAWLVALLASIFVGIEVLRSIYQLYVRERTQREALQTRNTMPSTTLAELVSRVVGTDDWGAAPQKVSNALIAIREKAASGSLSTWGKNESSPRVPEGFRADPEADLRAYSPIPKRHWTTAHIDCAEFLKDFRCATTDAKSPGAKNYSSPFRPADHYSDLHFDENEVENVWPTKRQRKFKWQSPIARPN
jgi:hypothetical protein